MANVHAMPQSTATVVQLDSELPKTTITIANGLSHRPVIDQGISPITFSLENLSLTPVIDIPSTQSDGEDCLMIREALASFADSVVVTSQSRQNSFKQVRFADTDGRPLAEILSFGDTPVGSLESYEATPKMSSVLSRILQLTTRRPSLSSDTDCIERLFPDPLSDYSTFNEKLRSQFVALESVSCRSGSIRGMIRVRNVSEKKSVFIRMTFDAWTSHNDWKATRFPILSSPFDHIDHDLFEFSVPIPPQLLSGTVISFAICFQSGDQPVEYWDNNNGVNYSLRYRSINIAVSTAGVTSSSYMSPTAQSLSELDAERANRIRHFVSSQTSSRTDNSPFLSNRADYLSFD